MTTKEAMDHLVSVLKSDPEYRTGWQANIAMAFKDQFAITDNQHDAELVHRVANKAALAFLEQLAPLREMPEEIPGALAVELTHDQKA